MKKTLQILLKPTHFIPFTIALIPLLFIVFRLVLYPPNFPIQDSIYRSAAVAAATHDGTLTPATFLTPIGGHITVFNHLLTAFVAYTTRWHYPLEVYINLLLLIGVFALFMWLAYRTHPQSIVWMAPALSLVVFSVRHEGNLIIGYNSTWFFMVLAILLMMAALVRWRGWAGFLLAMVWAFAASFTVGGGQVAWGIGLFYLLVNRYPHRWKWAWVGLWGIATGAMAALFIRLGAASGSEGSIQALNWGELILFVSYYVGQNFNGLNTIAGGIVVSTAALVLYAANLLYIWRKDRDTPLISVWFSLMLGAYAVALLHGLGRLYQGLVYFHEFTMQGWYNTPMLLFWCGVWVSMVMVLYETLQQGVTTRLNRAYFYSNQLAVMAFVLLYFPASVPEMLHHYRVTQDCVERIVFEQRETFLDNCRIEAQTTLNHYNQLAERRLTLYAAREPVLAVPADDDMPILVEASNPWINRHITTYYLPDANPEQVYHLYPDQAVDTAVMKNPPPPSQQFAGASDDLIETLTANDSFWYIHYRTHETPFTAMWDELEAQGYLILDSQWNGLVQVHRVQNVNSLQENTALFGEGVRLLGVTQLAEAHPACETITVQTLWQSEVDQVALPYSASLKLLTTDGQQVANTDAALTGIESDRWERGNFYIDERTLSLPCDLPAGEYWLAITLYHYQAPNEPIPVTGDVVPIFPDMALIKTLTVE